MAAAVSESFTLKDTSRKPQFMEMYSKMNYEDKVQPRTHELIQLLRDKPENHGKLPKGGSLTCIRQALKEVYEDEDEPDAVREKVLARIAEHVKLKEERNLAAEERTPESFLE